MAHLLEEQATRLQQLGEAAEAKVRNLKSKLKTTKEENNRLKILNAKLEGENTSNEEINWLKTLNAKLVGENTYLTKENVRLQGEAGGGGMKREREEDVEESSGGNDKRLKGGDLWWLKIYEVINRVESL